MKIKSVLVLASVLGFASNAIASGQASRGFSSIQTNPDNKPESRATLENVFVRANHRGITVEVICDRPVTPTAMSLTSPDRLVFDFSNTVSAAPTDRIAVHLDGVVSVRLGVQATTPPVTRVVLDLKQSRSYQVTSIRNRTLVTLSPTGNTSQAAALSDSQNRPVEGKRFDSAEAGSHDIPAATGKEDRGVHAQMAGDPSLEQGTNSTGDEVAESERSPIVSVKRTELSEESKRSTPELESIRAHLSHGAADNETASAPKDLTRPPSTPEIAILTVPYQRDSSPNLALIAQQPLPPSVGSAPSSNTLASLRFDASNVGTLDIRDTSRMFMPSGPMPDEYVIGEQDVLTITVWKERELSESVTVRPDGKVAIPLLNDVKAAGLTPRQLRMVLTERLKPFIVAPEVTVAVREINSRNVYLVGEVRRPGAFPLHSTTTTVLQILAEAGGLKDFARRKNIYLLRNEGGKQLRFGFNYDEVIRGKQTRQDITLKPGDMVVVP